MYRHIHLFLGNGTLAEKIGGCTESNGMKQQFQWFATGNLFNLGNKFIHNFAVSCIFIKKVGAAVVKSFQLLAE